MSKGGDFRGTRKRVFRWQCISYEATWEKRNTRVATDTFSDFNPLSEIANIPANIINVGNSKNKFLSAQPIDKWVLLSSGDDGSGRQQWYITSLWGGLHALQLVGGNTLCNSEGEVFLSKEPKFYDSTVGLVTAKGGWVALGGFQPIAGTPYYNFVSGNPMDPNDIYYLQSISTTSNDVRLRYYTQSDLAKWEIRPVGEYSVIDIKYYKKAEDVFSRQDQRIDQAEIQNKTSETITYHFTVRGTYTESSSFSNSEGISVATTSTSQVSIPEIDSNSSLSSNSSGSKSWAFGTSETKNQETSHTIDVPIPANTTVKVTAYKVSHKATVTYVATLQNTVSGKTFRVKGKWNGITCSNYYIQVVNVANNLEITKMNYSAN